MKRIAPFYLALLLLFSCDSKPQDKKVFLVILARNQEHFLPRYLKNLENFHYNKKLITVYINTNNNNDNTEEILKEWAKKNKSIYSSIIFESHEIPNLESASGHDWSKQRLKEIGKIRNRSLELAKSSGCDYYFVSDCDNFVAPETLQFLINKNRPIIAPMLYDIPDPKDTNANFYFSVDNKGYFSFDRFYYPIYHRNIRGMIKVPVVHCTYLIKKEYLDRLTYQDGSDDHEFVIFSRSARENNIDQFICNERDFGVQFAFMDKKMTLEEEVKVTKPFLYLP